MRRTTFVPILGLVAVVTVGITVGLRAQGREFTPPRVAFLDIHQVIEKYERSQAVEKSLTEAADRIRGEFDKKMRAIREEEAELDLLSKQSREYAEKKQMIETQKFLLQYQMKAAEQDVRKNARDEMANIYREIQDAVERYAKAMGLDVVLVKARGELPGETLPEVKFQIAVRPVLYSADGLDVTEPILSILNAK